jgi:hypothetical protein
MASDVFHVEHKLIRSKAFRTLDKWSMLIYFDFLRLRQMDPVKRKTGTYWIIKNNGKIVYPYSVAEKKGISRRNFRNSIDKLIERGFLDITHQGKGGRKPKGSNGDVTKYKIDDRWKEYGKPGFKPAKKPRKKDTRSGRGWDAIMHDPKRKEAVIRKRKKTLKNKNRCQK